MKPTAAFFFVSMEMAAFETMYSELSFGSEILGLSAKHCLCNIAFEGYSGIPLLME
jgi:hypothetical protein